MSTPNLGNIFDALIINPLKTFFGDLLKTGEADAQALAQGALSDLTTAENNAAAALTASQAKVDAYVNPLVVTGVQALGTAIEVSVPGLTALVTAAEPPVETAATGVTDAVILAVITKLAAALSASAKSTAAVGLSNLAGAS
jgi:hypothetical protein